MVTHTENQVQKYWRRGECFALQGVHFGSGRVAHMVVDYPRFSWVASLGELQVEIDQWLTIDSLVPSPQLGPYGLFPLAVLDFTHHGVLKRSHGGECGGDGQFGFVAITDRISDELNWLAFFEKSNPFVELHVGQDKLTAITNVGWEYTFPVGHPLQLRIVTGRGESKSRNDA